MRLAETQGASRNLIGAEFKEKKQVGIDKCPKTKFFSKKNQNFQQKEQKLSANSNNNKTDEKLSAKGTKIFSKY